MNNITLPQPHKIVKIIHETKAEYTFRVHYEGKTDHGQFFMLSIPKIGEAPFPSAPAARIMWSSPSVRWAV